MRIAVLIKQVPDSDDVRMDEVTGTMIREGAGAMINPLDLHALQEALTIRSYQGGEVVALSMGPPQAEAALREALALGADDVVFLSDPRFAASDTWATARTLASACEKTGPYDLILAGEKATDGETGQVGPEVAVMLGFPFSTYVSRVEFDGCGSVKVSRTVEDGIERQKLPLPCLLTVLRDINEPALPTLSGKKAARRAALTVQGMGSLGLSPNEAGLAGSPTRVRRTFRPSIARSPRIFKAGDIDEGIAALFDELEDRGLIDERGSS
ncbi:MAG: electron transfer flavoprotein subunit beta/FixA family protein [Thermovirgaceae bacterium]|nr:electron transfer flavoprotein subunit beta/FixA family protein [Synergistales bacterium]HPC75749.1 electron transfer flavoprotein subunit beta/FixA family protein [Synergistales bacterium]HRS48502.1 electron transfer flavoprotein subunit beta/FixA family protein [Thermovirgaceae bacterium]HRU90735.1 electron transfer flavoprotein subunit beta/FixA family protein [Thermovirgaceae bacterium]